MSLIRGGTSALDGISVSAFGDLGVSQETPITQVSSEYGLLGVLTAELGGTTSISDAMFTASTGTGTNNVAAIVSARECNQRAGQGLNCRISALFTLGAPNSLQQAGLISSESAFAFGYNGDSFGVLYGSGGELETQSLQVTTGAANENATITVDGAIYSVALTNSSINQNAYEIAQELNALEPRYRFTSNQDKVIALARLPDFGWGLWAFSAGTASATWTEIKNGTIPAEIWTPIESWNINPNFDIDPTKLNDFKIQIQGNVNFYIKEKNTGEYVLVHTIKYINSATKPSIENPTFRIGWAVRNSGNTSDIIIKGGYGSAFVEGMVEYNQTTLGKAYIQGNVGGVATNVLSFRNRAVFNDVANRAEIIPLLLSLGTDAVKPVIFEVIENPQTTDFLEWEYLDENNSLMEFSTTSAPITGTVVAVFTVIGSIAPIDIQKILKFKIPTSEFSISARTTSGANSDMVTSFTWLEDL